MLGLRYDRPCRKGRVRVEGTPSYWLDLFTGKTWQEFHNAGAKGSGFRESRWRTVQRLKPGDYLLCYLTGVSRFIGVLEVTSEPFKDSSPPYGRTRYFRVELGSGKSSVSHRKPPSQ
jgi:predicted RNA-binding protein